MAALLWFFFSITYLTYFSGTILLSTVLKSVNFILSLFFSFFFKYRIFMLFLLLTYLHSILLYKNNFSVNGNFLPGDANRHSKQLMVLGKLPPGKLPPGWSPPDNSHPENSHLRKFPPWITHSRKITTRKIPTQDNSHPDNSHLENTHPG